MNFGSGKTKLDWIIQKGNQRIDDAIEAVIDKHCPVVEVIKTQVDAGDKEMASQRINSLELAIFTRQATLASPYNAGMCQIGQQSAFGSPEYILGAAFRNARGML